MNKANNTARRVCIVCDIWESGGIEAFLYNILTHINTEIFKIDIVTSELRESIFFNDLQNNGIRFFELSGNRYNFRQNFGLFRKHLSTHSYDVIHINAYQATSSYYAKIAKSSGIAFRILHSHNNALKKDLLSTLKLVVHDIYKILYTKYATQWWACSSQAASFMFSKKIINNKLYQIIPNAINLETFRFNPATRNCIREEMDLQDYLVIGHVGRLCKQKNQSFLLDVFQQIKQNHKKSRLLLIGDGADREKLEKKAAMLGITESVRFYGNTDRVSDLLMAMDIFFFPSIFEGFGTAVLEAQASGLPVLCSEQIPKEAIPTRLAHSVSLSLGAGEWAMRGLELYYTHKQDRQYAIDDLYQLGFDIQSLALQIEHSYMDS